MKFVIAVAFVLILGALAVAGLAMLRGGRKEGSKGGDMMRALAVRIAVSVLLFVCIVIAWSLGWIHPTGIPFGR